MRASRTVLALLLVAGCDGVVTADSAGLGAGGDDGGDATGDGSGANGGGSCERTIDRQLSVEAFPPDVVLVVDRSSTMAQSIDQTSFVRRWDVMRDTLDTLVDDFATRVNFGLAFVPPVGEGCDVAGAPLEVLPAAGSGRKIPAELEHEPGSAGTPTAQMLHSALDHFRSHPVNANGRYVVLATDGVPMCGLDPLGDTLAELRALRSAGVDTYVLGYDGDRADEADALTAMADAGGTGAFFPVDAAADLEGALESITSGVTTVACEYDLPADGGITAGNLSVGVGDAILPYSPEHADGWDYDPDAGVLSFYGDACDALREPDGGAIRASFCQDVD
jgi:hypothetical protein